MSGDAPVPRRVLLGRLASGTGITATFLLPRRQQAAFAATPQHHATSHHAAPHAGAASGHAGRPPSGAKVLPAPRPPPPLVMLDPGHGGKDPGAIGYSGTYEKHIALAAAQELKRMLETGGRYRVVLTRSRDVFVALDERVSRAQEHGAALFMSMHADALSDHSVRGASVYTLARTASDPQTEALARRENSADRFEGRGWRGNSPEVEQILASLVRQETRIGSARLARKLVGSLDQDLPMLSNPERHAGFQVLKAADIPSVLVEMGFMSNPRDEAALRRTDHRHKVALAMQRAVEAWFAATNRTA